MGAVDLKQVREIQRGAEGVRVIWLDGGMTYVDGEIGFRLWRSWIEQKEQSDEGNVG